jgi:hypothetical protein
MTSMANMILILDDFDRENAIMGRRRAHAQASFEFERSKTVREKVLSWVGDFRRRRRGRKRRPLSMEGGGGEGVNFTRLLDRGCARRDGPDFALLSRSCVIYTCWSRSE